MSRHEKRRNISIELVRRFFSNVDYLRSVRGLSYQELADGLRSEGFSVSRSAVSYYSGRRKGSADYVQCSTYYMAAFSEFFGVGVVELLSQDFRAIDEARKMESK